MRTGKYSLDDYNFKTPNVELVSSEPTVFANANGKFETYDYPGLFLNKAQGQTAAKIRMQEEEVQHKILRGAGVCRAFAPGYKFELHEHYRPDMNASYVLTEVQHEATVGDSYTYEGDQKGEKYTNKFACIPAEVPFRPPRTAPKPFVQGPQTAVVVGRSGEEIYTDEYGRVKVQFFWDRVGKKDENSYLLDPHLATLGGKELGRHVDPSDRPGSHRQFSRRRSRSANHHRAGVQRRPDCSLQTSRQPDR